MTDDPQPRKANDARDLLAALKNTRAYLATRADKLPISLDGIDAIIAQLEAAGIKVED